MSTIGRRKWAGTDIVDGTQYLKVCFNEQGHLLPYSTKFETLKGTKYYRVIHDRQVRVAGCAYNQGTYLESAQISSV